MSLDCYYTLGGLNYKNGFVTSCPQQHEKMQIMDEAYLPSEIFNNEYFKKHRLEMMSGKWSKGCDMCEHVEHVNAGKSMRQQLDADTSFYNKETGESSFKGLETVEIRFSHSCNMACLHCSQVFSSGWLSKLKRYTPDEEVEKYDLLQLAGKMHRQDTNDDLTMQLSLPRALEIVDDLNANFPNLERVDFAGGEVLYQKQFFPTLERLAQHPNAKNIKIIFHSNFNADFDPVKLSDALRKFGYAHIMMSIDAGPRIYSYFRDGDWDVLKRNIDKFREVNQGHTEMNVVCTTGTYQLMEIKDAFLNFLDLNCNFIDASIIYTPFYLNPAVMMLKFRSKVLNDIENTRNSIFDLQKQRELDLENTKKLESYYWDDVLNIHVWQDILSAIRALEDIRKYILNYSAKRSHWKSFCKYIEKTDVIWKQDFNNYFENYKFLDGDIVANV